MPPYLRMIVFIVYFLCALLLYKAARDWHGTPLPPGPRGLPLLGSALQMPKKYSWVTFAEWAKTYGEIMHVSVLGRPFIILSSREAISELLEKRGVIYSDRPIIPMAGELAGLAKDMPMMSYGPRHKQGRKLILGTLNARNAPSLNVLQEAKAAQYVSKVSDDPNNIRSHNRWLVASMVLQITHGLIVDSCDDPRVVVIQEGMEDFSRMATPGAYLVDSLPVLTHIPECIPGAGFKKIAREVYRRNMKIKDDLYDAVKEQVAQGIAIPSFTSELIQKNPDPSPEELDLYKRNALVFYGAGADTTVSVLDSFLIIMAQYPNIQRMAQAEIDKVVGHARLPMFCDRKNLPYLDAVLKEVHRVNPVGPLALPHKVTQDDFYQGYRIPAGSTVLANTWAILHDPAVYPNPGKVDPERFLPKCGDMVNPDPRPFAFGYGRRACPGQMLAEDTLFIVATAILASFDISDAISLDGTDIEYEGGGIISHPCPFKCTVTPRNITTAK